MVVVGEAEAAKAGSHLTSLVACPACHLTLRWEMLYELRTEAGSEPPGAVYSTRSASSGLNRATCSNTGGEGGVGGWVGGTGHQQGGGGGGGRQGTQAHRGLSRGGMGQPVNQDMDIL